MSRPWTDFSTDDLEAIHDELEQEKQHEIRAWADSKNPASPGRIVWITQQQEEVETELEGRSS